MIVLRIKDIWTSLILVHVSAVIAPPRRLSDYCKIELGHAFRPALRRGSRRQRAAIKEVLLHPIRKRQTILGTVDQAGVQTARHIRVAHPIVVRGYDQLLAVPRDVFESSIRG